MSYAIRWIDASGQQRMERVGSVVCQFCGTPFPLGPDGALPPSWWWTHECQPMPKLRTYVTYGAAEAPVGLTPPLKTCDHCYCIPTTAFLPDRTAGIAHHQCCNCGNKHRDAGQG